MKFKLNIFGNLSAFHYWYFKVLRMVVLTIVCNMFLACSARTAMNDLMLKRSGQGRLLLIQLIATVNKIGVVTLSATNVTPPGT